MIDKNCPFCMKKDIILDNKLAKSFWCHGAATPGHVLVVPKNHRPTIFDCTRTEMLYLFSLTREMVYKLDNWFHPGGYQISANCYSIGGQSVPHCHIHIMPRYYNQKEPITNPCTHIDRFPKNKPFINPQIPGKGKGYSFQEAWKIWYHLTNGKINPKYNAELK